MATTAQDRFKALLAGAVGPGLREQGFRRKDATFRRERDGAWQIVNLQRSKYATA